MRNVFIRCANLNENEGANFFGIKTFFYKYTQIELICYDYVLMKYMYVIIRFKYTEYSTVPKSSKDWIIW